MLSAELEPSLSEDGKFKRISVSVPSEVLGMIDKDAAEVNETRSTYLVHSALARMGQVPMTLTQADLAALAELLGGKK